MEPGFADHPADGERNSKPASDAAAARVAHELASISFLWPVFAAAVASEATASYFSGFADRLAGGAGRGDLNEPTWSTPNQVALELPTMRLRDFSTGREGAATLVCAPFALHGATVADFAPGHSLVEALRAADLARVHVTDWRSATPDMRFLSIDSYLADLNVAVDELGPPVDLIGLCQGGWLALVYAARFPGKVRRLVLAGAPVDVRAGQSTLSRIAADVPLATFEDLVRLGDGRVLGHRALVLWGPVIANAEARRVLQVEEPGELDQRFSAWNAWTVDLPGTYYLQVVRWLYKENRLAEGGFVALGRAVELSAVRVPVFLLAARDDELVARAQLFAAARLVGTPDHDVETMVAPCGHLGLFLGAETLRSIWPRIARWLADGRSQRARTAVG